MSRGPEDKLCASPLIVHDYGGDVGQIRRIAAESEIIPVRLVSRSVL